MRAHDESYDRKLLTPHEFKGRPQSANFEDLYTPQELDLPDPTTGKKVEYKQTVLVLLLANIFLSISMISSLACLFNCIFICLV